MNNNNNKNIKINKIYKYNDMFSEGYVKIIDLSVWGTSENKAYDGIIVLLNHTESHDMHKLGSKILVFEDELFEEL